MDVFRAIVIAIVAAGVAGLMTPVVIRFARRVGAVDRPNERKVSRRAEMPLLGGLAVGAGIAGGFVAAWLVGVEPGVWPQALGFAAGAGLLMLVGAWDDRFAMRASVKLGFQILAACIAIRSGFGVDFFSNPISGETYVVPLWILWPVSLVWIVGVTNAMNLIDGLDGLSSGLGAIIAATLTVICWQAGQWGGVVIGLALFGALLGYLPFNFPPARIFLGDTGSLLIGFGLALLALEGYRKQAFLAFIVPILALAIPLLDTLLSIVRRVRSGRGVFSPDKLHMHHRLLHREGSHKNAVLMLYFLTGCFCMIAVSFSQLDGWLAFVYLAAVVAVTVRLLRNLDAFSLDVPADPESDSDAAEASGVAAGGSVPSMDAVESAAAVEGDGPG
ncbi:MAG: glycosyltransferase family 4 protein [Myxococcota bacterium]